MNDSVIWRGVGRGMPDGKSVFEIEFQLAEECFGPACPALKTTHQVSLSVETQAKTWLIFDAGYNFEVPLLAMDDVCAIVMSVMIAELQYRVPVRHVAIGQRTNEAGSFAYWDGVIQRVGDAILRLALDKGPYNPGYYCSSPANRSEVLSRFPCLLKSPSLKSLDSSPL